MSDGLSHRPVLLEEVVAALAPRAGRSYVDGTFGAGGYSRAWLEAAPCTVLAIDRDPSVARHAEGLQDEFGSRLIFCLGRFGQLDELAAGHGLTRVHGVVFDLGVSSMQLGAGERGFSFQEDGPLDMRMEPSGPTAGDVVNGLSPDALETVIAVLGEEQRARRIVKVITDERSRGPITRTRQLAQLVEKAKGKPPGARIHPATKTFQALRIYINDELGELGRGLSAAERVLEPEGCLAVVSFHSLEDRIVKAFFSERGGAQPRPSRHLPEPTRQPPPQTFQLKSRRATKSAETERLANPRARSAKLRVGYRTDAPARPYHPSSLGLPDIGVVECA